MMAATHLEKVPKFKRAHFFGLHISQKRGNLDGNKSRQKWVFYFLYNKNNTITKTMTITITITKTTHILSIFYGFVVIFTARFAQRKLIPKSPGLHGKKIQFCLSCFCWKIGSCCLCYRSAYRSALQAFCGHDKKYYKYFAAMITELHVWWYHAGNTTDLLLSWWQRYRSAAVMMAALQISCCHDGSVTGPLLSWCQHYMSTAVMMAEWQFCCCR